MLSGVVSGRTSEKCSKMEVSETSKEEKAETVTSPVIGATSVPITIELDLGTRKGNIVKVYIEKLVINQKLLKL